MMIQSMPVQLANAMLFMVGVLMVMVMLINMAAILVFLKMYNKPAGDQVLVRTGWGGTRVSLTGGMISYPSLNNLCHVYSGVILLKHPDTGDDWPVKLILDEAHAIKAMQSFGEKSEQDIKPALQAIIDQHRNDPDGLKSGLSSVGYEPVI